MPAILAFVMPRNRIIRYAFCTSSMCGSYRKQECRLAGHGVFFHLLANMPKILVFPRKNRIFAQRKGERPLPIVVP